MGSKSSKQQQQQQQRSTISGNNSTSVLGNKNTRRRDLENEEEESSDDSDEADDICDKNNNNNNNRNNNNNKLLSSSSSSTSLSPSSSFLSLENAVNVAGSRLTKLPNIVIGNIFHVIDNNRDKLALFNTCKKMRSLRNFLYFSNIDIAPPPYGRDYDYAFLDCAEMITLPLSIYNHFISTLYHLPAFINNNNIGNEDEKRQIKLKSLTIYDFEATGIDLSTLPNFINCITLVGPFNSSVGMENNNNQLNNSINSLLSSNGITRQREFIIPDHVTSLTHYYTGRGNSPLTTCHFPNVKTLTILPPPTIRDLPSSPSQSLSSSTSSTSSLTSTSSSAVWPNYNSIHTSFTHLCVTKNGLIPNMSLSQLTHIRFNNEFNSPIYPGLLPNTVTHLRLGERFQQHLEPGSLPASLRWVCFGFDYNSMISVGVLPESLLHVINISPAPGSLPSRLRSLILSPHFNNPLGKELGESLKHLRTLDIGGFNRLLDAGMLPRSLGTLVIGRSYDNRIETSALPMTLSKIVDRSLPLANGISYPLLPSTITTLEIEHYDQSVKGALPQSLDRLVLYLNPSNTSVIHLPPHLTHLTLKGCLKQSWTSIFPQPLKSSRDNDNNNSMGLLPLSLTHLSLLVTTRNSRLDERVFPPRLTHLKFGDSFEITQIKTLALPDSLSYLWFGKSFNLPFGKNVLPPHLKFLRLGSEYVNPLQNLPKSIETLLIDCQYIHSLPVHIPRIKFENRFDLENFTLYCGFPYHSNQLIISEKENDDEFNI